VSATFYLSTASFHQRLLFKFINFWPPFLGAGIRLKRVSRDFTEAEVELKLRFWNRNYVGVHFGGSLYAMTDPVYMLLAMEQFRSRGWLQDYVIWDKAASIRFKMPGRTNVRAQFKLTDAQVNEFKRLTDEQGRYEAKLPVQITNPEGELIAEVEKTLYFARKDRLKARG